MTIRFFLALGLALTGSATPLSALELRAAWEGYRSVVLAPDPIRIGSTTEENGTLVLNDLYQEVTHPLSGKTTLLEIPQIALSAQPDDSVHLHWPAPVSLTVQTDISLDLSGWPEPLEGPLVLRLSIAEGAGARHVITRAGDGLHIDSRVPETVIRPEEVRFDGVPVPLGGALVLSGLSGTQRVTGPTGTLRWTVETASLTLDNQLGLRVAGTAAGLSHETEGGTAPLRLSPEGGLAGDLADRRVTRIGPVALHVSNPRQGLAGLDLRMAGLTRESTMNAGIATQNLEMRDLVVVGDWPALPGLDGTVGLEGLDMAVRMPLRLGPRDAPQPEPVALRIALRNLAMTDRFWAGLGTGGGQLQGPISLTVDLEAVVPLAEGLLDLVAPGQIVTEEWALSAITLNHFLLRLAGAEVTASGQGRMGADGRMETGQLSLRSTGLQDLIRSFGQIGLIEAHEAMGMLAALGMFTRPGPGPGELVSDLEWQGQTLRANGLSVPF